MSLLLLFCLVFTAKSEIEKSNLQQVPKSSKHTFFSCQFNLLKCEQSLLFGALFDNKLNLLGFWLLGQTNKLFQEVTLSYAMVILHYFLLYLYKHWKINLTAPITAHWCHCWSIWHVPSVYYFPSEAADRYLFTLTILSHCYVLENMHEYFNCFLSHVRPQWESRVTQYERDFDRVGMTVRKEVLRFEVCLWECF